MAATSSLPSKPAHKLTKAEYDLFSGPSSTVTINGLLHSRINLVSAMTHRPDKKSIKDLVEEALWEKYGPKPEVED